MLKYGYVGLIFIMVLFLGCEYGIYGIMVILLFYFFRNKTEKCIIILQVINVVVCHFIFSISTLQFISLISLIFIFWTRKKENWYVKINWKIRYLNYLVYPIHLIIFYLIKFI